MKATRNNLPASAIKTFRARSQASAFTVLLLAAVVPSLRAADTFIKPTKEELSMTSMPGYPGAAAVVLFREEISKDDLHAQLFYDRIKILTEDGKKYANVELPFYTSSDNGNYSGNDNMVGDIVGRTIHADGTIIPFTGKPYLKVIEKEQGFKVQEKIFTLPDVEVGSIIEYRYALRYSDSVAEAPDWYIQGNLFLKAAHYAWYPTVRELVDTESGNMINAISWFPILPPGAQIQHHDLPGTSPTGATPQIYELTVKDIPPSVHEEYMPPIASYTYRVLFNFTQYHTGEEYWKSEGKRWSKRVDSFIGPNSELTAATQTIITGATTQDQKLHKIYSLIMTLDNTDYSRAHDRQEDKAAGLGKVSNTADVLSHKRGSGRELTELFIGMARAAGMKAYLMLVPDRSRNLFTSGWLNFRQFDGVIAVVAVDGKEQFFDPGERYCPYGHLEWENTWVQGLRQSDSGAIFAQAPGDTYTANKTGRVANVTMDEQGRITGKVNVSFEGAPALAWRQRALRGDSESLRHGLRTYLEEHLPNTLEVTVGDIQNLDNFEQPLLVDYQVKGTLGTPTGKRLVLPVDLFMAHSTASFPHQKRELAVYFHFPQTMQDALRINLPKNISLEATPASSQFDIKGIAKYNMTVTSGANNLTVRRTYIFNDIVVPPAQYPTLHDFYSQFEAKDQESVILKQVPAEAAAAPVPGGN